jgi:hypothetical protein
MLECPIHTILYYVLQYIRGNVTRRACWNYSIDAILWGHHESVRLACEKYPNLTPDDWERMRQHQAGVSIDIANALSSLHDIIGNPFRPVSLDPSWLTPTVKNLAQAAYDNRLLPSGLLDNIRLAVLADAVEEAGCTNPDILNHCRQPGEHVGGCWVVDLLLAKE